MSKKTIKKKRYSVSRTIVIGLFVVGVAGTSFMLIKAHEKDAPSSQYKAIHMSASFRLITEKHVCGTGGFHSSGCYQRNGDSFPGVGEGWQYTYRPVNAHMTVDEAYKAISKSIANAGYYVYPREDSDFQKGRVSMNAPGQRINISVEVNTRNTNEVPTMASVVHDVEVDAYQ
jgi:hypothetical protein